MSSALTLGRRSISYGIFNDVTGVYQLVSALGRTSTHRV